MGGTRRNSTVIENTTKRANGIKAFAPTLELAPGLTLSSEYEHAGGVRQSERRRTSRKAGTPPAS